MSLSANEGRWRIRALFSVLALCGVVAVGGWLVQRPGAPLGPPAQSPALAQALTGASGRPSSQSSALACSQRLHHGWTVHAHHHELLVTLPARGKPMTVVFRSSEKAAIIWAFDHHQVDNVYRNTNWFDSPLQLSDTPPAAWASVCPETTPARSARHG